MNPVPEIQWYGLWWVPFLAIAFTAARYFGWRGMVVGIVVISATIAVLDLNWIFSEMRHHPEHGRDADGIFLFGVLFRVLLFNHLLLPVSLLGLWLRISGKGSSETASNVPTQAP